MEELYPQLFEDLKVFQELQDYQEVLQEHHEEYQEILQEQEEHEERKEGEEQEGMNIDSNYEFADMLEPHCSTPHLFKNGCIILRPNA